MSDDILYLSTDSGLEARIEGSDVAHEAAMAAAAAIAAQARADAPVLSGAYRDHIGYQETKSGARVVASDQKSHWIEFGNEHEDPQFILRNAAAKLGYEFEKRR